MEAQPKSGFAMETPSREPSPTSSSPTLLLGFILRIIALKLTFIAAIVMGLAKQTVTATGAVDPSTGNSLIGSLTVKSTDNSSFVYFIVVNSLACVYSALTLAVSIAKRTNFGGGIVVALSVADLVMLILLFTGNAAAAGIAIVVRKGTSQYLWGNFCDVAGKFCSHIDASIVLSMLASVAYTVLVLLAIIGLLRRSSY